MPYLTDIEQLAEEKGRDQGRVEGRAEGQLRRAREDVLDALRIRFVEIPYELREAISHVEDDAQLRQLHRLAITVPSLDQFTV